MARGLPLRRPSADKKAISLVCADQMSTRIFQGSLSERISWTRPWRGLKSPCSRGWVGANPSVGAGSRGQWIALIYSSRGWRRRLPLQQLLSESFCTISRQQQRQKTNQRSFLKPTSRAPVTTRLAPRRRARRRQKEALDLLVKTVGNVRLDRSWNEHNKNVCNLHRFVLFPRRLGNEDPSSCLSLRQ